MWLTVTAFTDHSSRRAVPTLRANSHCTAACYVHRVCCNLLVWVSASKGGKQNGLGLVILQSSVLCLLETTAVLSIEIQKYLLIKIATPSTARQFQDTHPVCALSHHARIFGEQKNRLSAGAATFLQTALPHRQTEGPRKPLTDGHVRAQ